MTIREVLNAVDVSAVLEEMYASFPEEIDMALYGTNYYIEGFRNILNYKETYEGPTTVVELFNVRKNPSFITLENGYVEGVNMSNWPKMLNYTIGNKTINRWSKEFITCIVLKMACCEGNTQENIRLSEQRMAKILKETDLDNQKYYSAEEAMKRVRDIIDMGSSNEPPMPQIGEQYKDIKDRIYTVLLVGKARTAYQDPMIALQNKKGEIFMITYREMFSNISHAKFDNGKEQHWRYERI